MEIIPYEGKSNKTGKPYYAYKLTIGAWNTLIFPKSQFERDYLDNIIGDGIKAD